MKTFFFIFIGLVHFCYLFPQKGKDKILQSDYISQPYLWSGPSLEDSCFTVEIQIDPYGRDINALKKSVIKHGLGVYETKLPKLNIAEWGYTVLNLKSGQQDGSGRVIKNSYLDSLSTISTRKQALEKIINFIKEQYKYKITNEKYLELDGKTPWFSMNGHYCWHHYAGMYGASVLGSEIGENVHGYQLHIAMNRGAAKQYHTPWVIDFSSWFGPSILDYSTKGIWAEYSGITHGHSISLLERSMLMSYMAGADAVIAEAGGAISFYDEKTIDGTYRLTPYGEVFQHLMSFARKYKVGITYTPIAIVLNKYHGMDRQPKSQKAFGIFDYNDGDYRTFNLIENIWPGTFSVETNGNEIGAMVNSAYADQFDFILQDASLDLLKTYNILMLSGNIELEKNEINNLLSYVKDGGILLIDEDNIKQLKIFRPKLNIEKKEYGEGLIVSYKHSALKEVLNKYFNYNIPFKISENIEYLVNIKDGAFYVTLINNDGITKTPKENPIIDDSKTKSIVIEYTGKAPLGRIKEIWKNRNIEIKDNEIKLSLEPGGAAVIEILDRQN